MPPHGGPRRVQTGTAPGYTPSASRTSPASRCVLDAEELSSFIDPARAILKASRIAPGRGHEARGHAQAAGGGARGTPAAGDRPSPGRPDLRRDRGAGGAEPGHGRFLDADQEAEARDLIRRHTPDELDLPFALWSRAAVRELIRRRFGVRLAVRTMGTYLARWGFTAQKPLRRGPEEDAAPGGG